MGRVASGSAGGSEEREQGSALPRRPHRRPAAAGCWRAAGHLPAALTFAAIPTASSHPAFWLPSFC